MKDKFFLFLSLISLCALCFVAGAAVMHFQPKSLLGLKNAFLGTMAGINASVSFSGNYSEAPVGSVRLPRSKILHREKGKYFNGLTLLTTPSISGAVLVNDKGKVLHRWHTPFSKAWKNPTHIKRVNDYVSTVDSLFAYPNGDLLVQYYGRGDTPYGYGLAKFNKDSELLWTFNENAHHDVSVSPDDGTISVIVHHFQKQPVSGFEYFDYPQLVDEIVTLSSDGEVVDRFSMLSALEGTPYASFYKERSLLFIKKNEIHWDQTHTNSVQRLSKDMASQYPKFQAGDYLVNMRNNKGVVVIDHKTKKAIWGVCCKWHGQHSAIFMGDNKIMLLDNYGRTWDGISNSRIVMYDITDDKKTILYGKDTSERLHTVNGGRLQLLPNGNILAVESARGHITEISQAKQVVWKYTFNPSGRYTRRKSISDAVRYSHEYFTFLSNNKVRKKVN